MKVYLRNILLIIFIVLFRHNLCGQSFQGTYYSVNDDLDGIKAGVDLSYTNFGSDEEPEWVWSICTYLDSGEVEDMWFMSENTGFTHAPDIKVPAEQRSSVAKMLDADEELRERYVFFLNNSFKDYLDIQVLYCITHKEEPIWIMIRAFKDDKPVSQIDITYSKEIYESLYGAMRAAIRNVGMKERTADIIFDDIIFNDATFD